MDIGYRVEVNQKSKYFKLRDKALDYFLQSVVANKNCELWFMSITFNEKLGVYIGTQTLLDYHSAIKVGT